MPKAARIGDAIAHTSALAGLVGGLIAGAIVGAAIALTVATGGLAAPLLIGAVLTGAAAGAWLGEFVGSLSCLSPPTGVIALVGSTNVFFDMRPAARVMMDAGMCAKEGPIPQSIVQGSSNVFINGVAAARVDDHLTCGAFIKEGSATVYIGGGQTTYDEFAADVPGWVHDVVLAMGVAGAFLLGGGAVLPQLVGGFALGWAGGKVLGALGTYFGPWLSDNVGGLPSDWEKAGAFAGQGLGGWLGASRGGKVWESWNPKPEIPSEFDLGQLPKEPLALPSSSELPVNGPSTQIYNKSQLKFTGPVLNKYGKKFSQDILVDLGDGKQARLGEITGDSYTKSVSIDVDNVVDGIKYSHDGTFKLSTEALKQGIESHRSTFGNDPKAILGRLKKKNLEIFHSEYSAARIADPNGSPGAWAEAAISRTPYGKSRTEVGYSRFEVNLAEMGNFTSQGKTYIDVPSYVTASATKPK